MPRKQTEIKFNLTGLEELKRQIGDSYVARVGILGGDAAEIHDNSGGMTNAEIGIIHEFGSENANIPPRSFLRMPVEHFRREIIAAMTKPKVQQAITEGNPLLAIKMLGVIAEGFVKLAFSSGGFGKWPALKPETIARKGSSKPLIDTGQLRRSISSDVVRKGDF